MAVSTTSDSDFYKLVISNRCLLILRLFIMHCHFLIHTSHFHPLGFMSGRVAIWYFNVYPPTNISYHAPKPLGFFISKSKLSAHLHLELVVLFLT